MQPTGKTLEEIDKLFVRDEALLDQLHHRAEEKPSLQQLEHAA